MQSVSAGSNQGRRLLAYHNIAHNDFERGVGFLDPLNHFDLKNQIAKRVRPCLARGIVFVYISSRIWQNSCLLSGRLEARGYA
jgi:hypothetical protein